MLGVDRPVAGDNRWQRVARARQSGWREARGLPAGLHRGEPLGSRLTPEDGEPPRLANYLTLAAKRQVQDAVARSAENGALLSRPRLWVDLLSSQPACFNAFGDMAEDHALATAVMRELLPDRVDTVTAVRFEYSPGRGDPRYTGNRSAFDVFVECDGDAGPGFIGVEVKYHEDMRVGAATDRGYAQMAREAGCFRDDAVETLVRPPLQQLLLDHLLALRMVAADQARWSWGTFVLMYPSENTACADVAARYAATLSDDFTFRVVTLERHLDALCAATGDAGWATAVRHRYLGNE